jgi:hypothetical protein
MRGFDFSPGSARQSLAERGPSSRVASRMLQISCHFCAIETGDSKAVGPVLTAISLAPRDNASRLTRCDHVRRRGGEREQRGGRICRLLSPADSVARHENPATIVGGYPSPRITICRCQNRHSRDEAIVSATNLVVERATAVSYYSLRAPW